MIIVPEKRIILPRITVQLQGFLRVEVLRPDGRVRWDSGFFPNKILDSGRNVMHSEASWLTHCHVGTGSATPTALDTQLQNFVVATDTIQANLTSTESGSPYFGWRRITFEFPQGAGHGGQDLSEAGVGWGAVGSVLVSRALIIDPQTQNPTTITPLADEILRVSYELRYYPPLIDATNSVTLNSVNYDTITRAAEVTNDRWSLDIGVSIGKYSTTVLDWAAYDGNIGTTLQSPNGAAAGIDNAINVTDEVYQNNSYEIVMRASCGINGWNLVGLARSIRIMTTAGMYQTQFTANPGGGAVPKDINSTWQMEWTLGWTEKV